MWNTRLRRSLPSAVLSAVTETVSFALSLVLSPLAALWRTLGWLAARARMNGYEFTQLLIRKEMREEAATSLEFLRTYMREHERLVSRYRQAHYRTLQEAQVGLTLFRLAEADLLERARRAGLQTSSIRPTPQSEERAEATRVEEVATR